MKHGVNKKSIKSDLARIDRMREGDIDYSDIPPLDKTFLKKATVAGVGRSADAASKSAKYSDSELR